MPRGLKRLLHTLGGLLAILGIYFVVASLLEQSENINFDHFGVLHWFFFIFLVVLYGSANGLLAIAWWHILRHFNVNEKKLWAIKVFGVSQIAKYVPGNIFHLASRQAVGIASGVPGWILAKSQLFELLLLATTGLLFMILVAPLALGWPSITLATLLLILVFLYTTFTVRSRFGQRLAFAILWHFIFLAISGAVFFGALSIAVSNPNISSDLTLPIIGTFVTAWLLGFIAPGAPAGLGIREVVVLFLLAPYIPGSQLIMAVVLTRSITVLGDGLFFCVTSTIRLSSEASTILLPDNQGKP